MLLQQTDSHLGLPMSFPSPVTAGSTIVVVVSASASLSGVTDDHSQTYTNANATGTASGLTSTIWYKQSSVGGVSAIDVGDNSGSFKAWAYELSSETFSSKVVTSGNSASVVGGNLTGSGFFVSIALWAGVEGNISGVSSPFVFDNSIANNQAAAHIDGGSGTQASTFTVSGSSAWAVSSAFFTSIPACAPRVIVGGAWQDNEGNPLANGYLTFRLNTDAVSCNGGQAAAGRLVTVPLDANGNIVGSPTTAIWANGNLTPAGTTYSIIAYTAKGQPVWNNPKFTLPAGAGSYSFTP